MDVGYFENALSLHSVLTKRKHVVQEQLSQFGKCDCVEAPNVPCCLLQTELDSLQKYLDILDRELWCMRSKEEKETLGRSLGKEHLPSLCSTVEAMLSSSWEERLKAEWAQLCIRMEQLDNFRDRFRAEDVDFVPKWDERLLCD